MVNIRLAKTDSVKSENKPTFLDVSLNGTSKDLRFNNIRKMIDSYEVYRNERQKCNKYRLILTVNPFCTNVLFNPLTEIARFTATNNGVRIERVTDSTTVNGIDGSNTSKRVQFIANTTYSNEQNGYIYYPGFDIFDNHILRSTEFSVISGTRAQNGQTLSQFNTISDYARDSNGDVIKMFKRTNGAKGKPNEIKKHVYNYETLMSYEDCVNTNLSEQDGWLGFPNSTKLVTYDKKDIQSNWNRVLNNRSASEFIQMYPDRSTYTFTPYYNEKLNRLEYNWDILITYPYENEYDNEMVKFNATTNALRLYEGKIQKGFADADILMFRSYTKHNLVRNDNVRLLWRFKHYDDSELKYEYISSADVHRVANIGNLKQENEEYYFYVDDVSLVNEVKQSIEGKKKDATTPLTISDVTFYIQKITNGLPSKYYIRKFKKLEYNGEMLSKEQYGLSFATTIYNDGVTQITFTDDLDFDGLTDNLGRPVCEFFITFLKTSLGNKEWYNEGATNITKNAENVEISHCFTRLTDGLNLHSESNDWYNSTDNAQKQRNLYNIRFIGGNHHKWLSEKKLDAANYEWVKWHGITKDQEWFYGDVVEFITSEYKEYVLSDVNYRFNTYQRENPDKNSKLVYHNIVTDDYDFKRDFSIEKFEVAQEEGDRDEGYFYKPHYPIRMKEDGELEQGGHYTIRLRNVEVVQYEDIYLRVVSLQASTLNSGDLILLMDDKNGEIFQFKVTYVTSKTTFLIYPVNGWFGDNGFIKQTAAIYQTPLTWSDVAEHLRQEKDMFLRRCNESIPPYAVLSGRNIFLWRSVYNSGDRDDGLLPDYVFANNRFYITPVINFYLKRQDPNGYFGLYRIENQNPQDINGETKKASNYEYKDTETAATTC